MAYPLHALFSFGGPLLGGAEQWSNNIRFGTSGVTFTDSVGAEPDVLAYLMGLLTSDVLGSLGYSGACALKWGKFNQIGADGRYRLPNDTVRQDIAGTGVVGLGTPIGGLPQAALAITFRTAAERGRASRGRVFVPMPAVTVDGAAKISGTQISNIAIGWDTFLTKCNDSPLDQSGADCYPAVISGIDASMRRITGVQVGNVVDTMRSRRAQLTESYTSVLAVTDA